MRRLGIVLAGALAAGALVLAPSLGLAEPGSAEVPEFGTADRDGDGTVTLEEAKQAGVPVERARSQDIDGDGELTKIDWKFLEPGSYGGSDDDGEGG